MQRYFTEKKLENHFVLSQKDSYHIKTVMRMNLNDTIEIVYQNKLYIGKIIEFSPFVTAEIVKEMREEKELAIQVTIVQSLVKEQKMDYILQKATELGVTEVIPFAATRSIVKLEEKQDKKIERWQKIMKEAAEQSKRTFIPKVTNVLTLQDLLTLSEYDLKFLCTVNETSQNIKKLLSNIPSSAKILFVIGPEGGFTPHEEKSLIEGGFISLSLGKSILRTETASTFIMSVIRYLDME